MSSKTAKPLQGYRIGFLRECEDMDYTQYFTRRGASILYISRAPRSEDEFMRWWSREVARASRDRVVIVVMRDWHCCPGYKKWLGQIEEGEWYGERESGADRVRITTCSKLRKAVQYGALLTDDWGDIIKRGPGHRTITSWCTKGSKR